MRGSNILVNDIHHVHSILFCFTTIVTENYGKELLVIPKEVYSINTKDTLATDDDKQLKANNIIYKSVSFQL